jgi:putative lipoic acid-binding regulatory protein
MSDAHQIEFPCRYPIKIIVATAESQVDEVVEILRRHSPSTTPSDMDPHHSRGAKFVSLRVNLWAEGEDHLQTLYEELLNHPAVRIIL